MIGRICNKNNYRGILNTLLLKQQQPQLQSCYGRSYSSTALQYTSRELDIDTISTPSPTTSLQPLTEQDIEFFKDNGYLIKKRLYDDHHGQSIMNKHQVEIRDYLIKNAQLDFGTTSIGSKQEAILLSQQQSSMAKVSNGFGGMVNYYHGPNMYNIRQYEPLYNAFSQLYKHTYSAKGNTSDNANWPNSYTPFNPNEMYMFVNRCSFRIPIFNTLQQKEFTKSNNLNNGIGFTERFQKGTGTHLDCNPFHLFKGEKMNKETGVIDLVPLRFWQPIQAFVSLVDTLHPEMGGFWCLPKFPTQCVDYFHRKYINSEMGDHPTETTYRKGLESLMKLKRGNAFELDDKMDEELVSQMQYIPVERGDVLFWDWRMPHHSDQLHHGDIVREVVYAAHLPNVKINQEYAAKQLEWYKTGSHPSYVSKQFSQLEVPNYIPPQLSPLGLKLLNVNKW